MPVLNCVDGIFMMTIQLCEYLALSYLPRYGKKTSLLGYRNDTGRTRERSSTDFIIQLGNAALRIMRFSPSPTIHNFLENLENDPK